MTDLTTRWLGLNLQSPLILGANPLSTDVDFARACQEEGAGAIVLPSVFEEQLVAEQLAVHRFLDARTDHDAEARSYLSDAHMFSMGIETYLRQLDRLRSAVNIPVIASLNGTTPGGWTHYAEALEDAGASAIELNLYDIATDPMENGQAVESRQLDVIRNVCSGVRIPVAVKLAPTYTALPAFVKSISEAGAAGVVLFNRLYQPEIDLDALSLLRTPPTSSPAELPNRLHALAILYGRTPLPMAASGGICSGVGAAKAILCGANVLQLVSAASEGGAKVFGTIRRELDSILTERGYRDLEECRGVMSLQHAPDPQRWERLNYAATLQGWRQRRS